VKRHLTQAGKFVLGGAGLQLLVAVLLLTSPASALALDVTSVFVPPSGPLAAGRPGSLWLYCMNNSSNEVSQTFQPSLNCLLASGSGSFGAVLLLNTNRSGMKAAIAPGGFVKAEYLLDVPAISGGPVTLAVSNYNPVVILVTNDSFRASAPAPAPPASPLTNTWDFLGRHLSAYEPIYFILGSYPAAEFQFSIKYKVLNLINHQNPLDHLYFAYTQTSFWDLISPDPSFYDSSYKPSVFLYYADVLPGKNETFFHLDLQGGAEHESNGRGGAGERSLYTAYLQPTATFDLPYHLELTLQPRARIYYWVGHNNPDLADYRGYADLLATLTWTNQNSGEKIQLATKLRIGDEGTHAGLQFDFRFNLPLSLKFNPTIQVQYFTGYGQTLRQYNQPSHAFRAGLCLWY
jgi:outer membrane phospholipase A